MAGHKYYEILAGEPAFTIFPNLSFNVIGILAILFSVLLIIWSIIFINRKNGGLVLILLAIFQFFFGVGMADPVTIGIIIGFAATKIDSDFSWMKNHNSIRTRLIPISKFTYIISVLS